MAIRDVAHDEPERRQVVRRLERFGVAKIDLVLPRGDLVMPGLHFESHRDEIFHDKPADFLRAVDRRLIEIAAAVVRLGRRLALGVELKNEELGLHAGHHFVPESLGFGDLPFQRLARAARE